MEIEPASIAQLHKGRDGRMIQIDDDVNNIVKDIRDINANFHVRYSELGKYFVVYFKHPLTGDEYLVTTAQELDKRLVGRMSIVASDGYDYKKELEKIDAAAERNHEYIRKEQTGELAERLAHAIRQDTGHKSRATIPAYRR